MKVMVVVLVAIAVAAVLVLFYGAVRPAGDVDESKGGVDGGLGFLAPSTVLGFDDVAEAGCADPVARSLVVEPNGACVIALAEPAELRLCPDPVDADLAVVVDGADYPEQRLEASDLGCAPEDDPIRIYDTESVLTIRCLGLAQCVLVVAD